MTYKFVPRWGWDDTVTLPALRSCFAYSERAPDRATGYLYAARQVGSLPVTRWPAALTQIGPALLDGLEDELGTRFTVVAFQAYLGGAGCGWHHDRDWAAQAIYSLGVTRTFGVRRGGAEQFLRLVHGDLLYMPPGFQDEWEHSVPTEEVPGERCSLVFRTSKGA